MATMAITFDAVQDNVTFTTSGVSIAERMHALRRIMAKTFLVSAYHNINTEQRELIAMLDAGMVQRCECEDLAHIAERLDLLVKSTNELIRKAELIDFRMWKGSLRALTENTEKLESLSESFHMSASEQCIQYVGALVESAVTNNGSTSTGDWRQFVATLHD